MSLTIERKQIELQLPEIELLSNEKTKNLHEQWKQGNISLSRRVEGVILSLPPESPILVLGNADDVITKKYKETMRERRLTRVNPEDAFSLQPGTFPLVVGNLDTDEIENVLDHIHQLSKPFGDVYLNIYLGNSDVMVDEESIDRIMHNADFYLRGSSLKQDYDGKNTRWEVDMMQTPKDLPSYRRSGPYTYRTGSNWEEFYY